jgi:hypothetical protein
MKKFFSLNRRQRCGPGCLSRRRLFPSQIPYPGSRVAYIPNPGSGIRICIKDFYYFNPKTDTKFSKIRSGMFIPDPGSGFFSYTVQTVDLILPCIGRIPQLHSCIEKKILLNSLCWLGGKFMLSSSKQVGTGPWFESPT